MTSQHITADDWRLIQEALRRAALDGGAVSQDKPQWEKDRAERKLYEDWLKSERDMDKTPTPWHAWHQRGLRDGERIGLEKAAKVAENGVDVPHPVIKDHIIHGWAASSDVAAAIRALITKEQSDE